MSESRAARTRHPKSITRTNILNKAYEMYLDRRLVHGDERLSSVLDELGYTTGAGYQIWANQAAFRHDLQVFVATNIEYASLERVADEAAELAARKLPYEQHVLEAGDLFVEAYLGHEGFYLTLRFFAMAQERPEEITEALADAYERAGDEVGQTFAAALERFERRLRPSLTMADLTAAVTATIEGYALRARVQPHRVSGCVEYAGGQHHVFSLAFLALVNQFTEPIPES